MFKCLCCHGRQRRGEAGGSQLNKFKPENVQVAADARASDLSASERYQRKKLDDDHPGDIGGGEGVRNSTGKGLTTTAPVHIQQQVAPPPPPPLPVVAGNQQKNLWHAEKPVVGMAEAVLPVRLEHQFMQPKPSALSQPKPDRQHEDHVHSLSGFKSDETETTIVDSGDEDGEEKLRPAAESRHAARTTVTLSVILPRPRPNRDEDDEENQLKEAAERLSTFLLAEEDNDEGDGHASSGLRARGGHLTHHQPLLETLLEEEPFGVLAPMEIQTDGADQVEEEILPPPLSQQAVPEQQQQQQQRGIEDDPFLARESLLALDQALAVFELASSYYIPTEDYLDACSKAAVNSHDDDEELIDEEEIIQTTPRS